MAAEKIMIVEDEILIAMEIQRKLNNLGYTVTDVVSSGEEAVQTAGTAQPDLVLMDIKLAGEMDGVEAATRIHDRYDIPIVYLTAHTDEKTLQRAKLAQPFGYLVKPFSEVELRTTIEVSLYKHLQERKSKDTAACFTKALEVIGGAVIVTDENGLVRHMNSLAETLTGWNYAEAVGLHLSDVYLIKDRKSGAFLPDFFDELAREGFAPHHPGYVLVARNKSEIAIEQDVLPLENPDGNVNAVTFCFREAPQGGQDSRDWLSRAANLHLAAGLCVSDGAFVEAESFQQRALELLEKNLGGDHLKVAQCLEELADIRKKLGKIQDAKLLETRAARIRSGRVPVSAEEGE
ncbi:MAG: response regulator [Candidatus Hadarchaeota archaeon]